AVVAQDEHLSLVSDSSWRRRATDQAVIDRETDGTALALTATGVCGVAPQNLMNASPDLPDVYSVREIARAAGVRPRDVDELAATARRAAAGRETRSAAGETGTGRRRSRCDGGRRSARSRRGAVDRGEAGAAGGKRQPGSRNGRRHRHRAGHGRW